MVTNNKYDQDEHPVQIYELARAGLDQKGIAETIGVSTETLRKWVKKKPAVKFAMDRGKQMAPSGDEGNLIAFSYKMLSPKVRKLWDEIEYYEYDAGGHQLIEDMLKNKGRKTRQRLFLHALVYSNYNVNRALEKTCVTKQTLSAWTRADPDFAEAVAEIEWLKKNFLEDALLKLVAKGDPRAIIFANKTYNKDRGYNEKVEVNVGGEITHNHLHTVIPVSALDSLSIDTRKELLEAVRDYKANAIEEADVPQPKLIAS